MECLKYLRKVGIQIFIHYHHLWFKPKDEAVEQLCRKKASNNSGAILRTNFAKQIIASNESHKNCLEYIVYRANVPIACKSKAERILLSMYGKEK